MAKFNMKFNEGGKFNASFNERDEFGMSFGEVQVVETGNYDALSNKPSIENVTLQGNKTIQQIGVGTATIPEIEKILYLD